MPQGAPTCSEPGCGAKAHTGVVVADRTVWLCPEHHLRLVANLLEPWVLDSDRGPVFDADALLEELAQEVGVIVARKGEAE